MEFPGLSLIRVRDLLHGSHHHADRVTPANCVSRGLDGVQEGCSRARRDGRHGGDVKRRDTLMDGRLSAGDAVSALQGVSGRDQTRFSLDVADLATGLGQGISGEGKFWARLGGLGHVVCITEAETPMAEIGANDKRVLGVREIGSQ